MQMPVWRSSDVPGTLGHPNFHTSTLENGYFYGRDYRGIGQKGSILPGAARATTYYDTGMTDVAIEVTWEANLPYPLFPTVCVTPDEGFEHDLSPYFEFFATSQVTAVVWNVGQPAWLEGIAAFGPNTAATQHVPKVIRAEVVGRRLRSYLDDVFKMEYVIPPHMAGSTLHGVSQDTQMKYAFSEASPTDRNLNPYYPSYTHDQNTGTIYEEGTGLESNFSITAITKFSDEEAGTLGSELLEDTDFLGVGSPAVSVWTTNEPTQWDENNVYSSTDPVSLPGATVTRASPNTSPFTSGYYDQELTTPLVNGNTYRITLGLISQLADNGYFDVPYAQGKGYITAEFYDLSPAANSGVVLSTQITVSGSPFNLTSAITEDFVAAGDYTHVRLKGIATIPAFQTTYQLQQTVNYVSVKRFIPDSSLP